MKILVTGAQGQLGRQLVRDLAGTGHDIEAAGRGEIDFSMPRSVREAVRGRQADWVINCAAYTQVDRAEDEVALAECVNRDSVAELAAAVADYQGRLIHISTDFVFGGDRNRPYSEADAPAPLGVYGRSKWQGEEAIRELLPNALILRTAWVFGVDGHNFVRTILGLAQSREKLSVVDDQIGTPTWTGDICQAITALMSKGEQGTFHFTNEGCASWYDLAVAVVQEATRLGYPVLTRQVVPVPTEAYPTRARRPAYSVLSKQKIRPVLEYPIPYWRDSLSTMMNDLKSKEAR